jgi:hypothetical protein
LITNQAGDKQTSYRRWIGVEIKKPAIGPTPTGFRGRANAAQNESYVTPEQTTTLMDELSSSGDATAEETEIPNG